MYVQLSHYRKFFPKSRHLERGARVLQGWTLLQRGTHSGLWSQSHPLYRHKEVAAGVWWVEEKYFASSWNLANIYFIKGSEADLLIDTGVGVHEVILSGLTW